MYKIIFFDIDGTLIPLGAKKMSKTLVKALNDLHDQGVLLFLATGRPNIVLPKFEDVPFDGALTFNAQYCFNKKETIFSNPIDTDDLHILLDNCKKYNTAIQLASNTRMGCNLYDPDLVEYFEIANQKCEILDDFDEFSYTPIYQAMLAVPEDKNKPYFENTSKMKMVYWWPKAGDIIPSNGGKDIGVQKTLEYYGFKKEESMAFGDGGNDIPMLEACGTGVAMGNAVDQVKEIADYITDNVEDDGIVSALKHFNMI